MANVKEFSVEEKLASLISLQKIESKLDEYKVLKGELPMEVSDLEDEIQGSECTADPRGRRDQRHPGIHRPEKAGHEGF